MYGFYRKEKEKEKKKSNSTRKHRICQDWFNETDTIDKIGTRDVNRNAMRH